MFLPIFGPYFSPLWLFPYFKGPFLLVQLFCFILCLFTLLKKILYTFCSILFFDWGHTAMADTFRGSHIDAVWIFGTRFKWSSLCPVFIALTLSNKIIIELSNVVFVKFPIINGRGYLTAHGLQIKGYLQSWDCK